MYQIILDSIKTWLAERKPHEWILQKVQSRLDMQNVYMPFGSFKTMIEWLEDMAAREKGVADGTIENQNAVFSSIAGTGEYNG